MQKNNAKILEAFKNTVSSTEPTEILKALEKTRDTLKAELPEEEHLKIDVLFRKTRKPFLPKIKAEVPTYEDRGESIFDIGTRIL